MNDARGERRPNELSARQASEMIGAQALSSEALVSACLEHIEARDSDVKAWSFVDPDLALSQARQRDREQRRGPLHGIPIGLKDIVDTCDMPTSYGSAIYPGYRPSNDAASTALLRRAGAVILGKTVTTEFAYQHPGETRNPHNPGHTPGGSSSGSAAAVADHMVPLAFGTQTGGSVIRPASFCGVVGYKPSFGEFSYVGVKVLAGSLDTLGAFSRCAGDMALLRQALVGAPAELEPLEDPPRIGLCRTPWWDRADPASRSAVEDAALALGAAGAEVTEVELPERFAGLIEANGTIMMFEGRRSLAFEFESAAERLSETIRANMADALDIPYERYRDAKRLAGQCRWVFMNEVMGKGHDFDALLVPSAPGEAPMGLGSTGNALFNRGWTTIGVPCVTLPASQGPKGLPVGVQLVGRKDDPLLAVADWCERALSPR
jgi:amidase